MKHFEALYPEDSYSKQVDQIVQFLKEGNSCQIIGLPGVGKSNLLRLLAYNHNVRKKHFGEEQRYAHFVYMNFSEIKVSSSFEINKYIFLSLADSLRDRGMEIEHKKIHSIFKEHYSLQDELVLFQGLKEAVSYLASEKKLSTILLFDRFQEFFSFLTNDFFANLTILRNVAKYRFAIILALNRPIEQTVPIEKITHFYEFLAENIIFLPITDKSSLEFRIEYLKKLADKKTNASLIKRVFELTGGHNKLTRLAVEFSLKQQVKIGLLDNLLLEKPSVQSSLFEIWNFLTETEQKQLEHKEDLKNSPFLEQVGLLQSGKITIPLFESFVQKGLFKAHLAGKIVFDKNKREVKIGNALISSRLTSLEFNLLKFLIENEGKVLEREEIVNTVWKDNATVEGVTDQALDQLIFRLRKKIEPNLERPIHIVSVKGRGIIFKA